jgi:hypothetical protein
MNKLPPLSYYYHNKIPLYERGKGLYKLGDLVVWCNKIVRIVEVVPYGTYPMPQKKLRVRGYYREYESYVVEDSKGQKHWPKTGSLKLFGEDK